jgi:hypothetical protein
MFFTKSFASTTELENQKIKISVSDYKKLSSDQIIGTHKYLLC